MTRSKAERLVLLEWAPGTRKQMRGMPEDVQKKARQGKKTPQADRDRVLERYKLARRHYEEHQAARMQPARKHGQHP